MAALFEMVKAALNVAPGREALCLLQCDPDPTRTGKIFSAVSAWHDAFIRGICSAPL
jgi:hypothetical protein